MLKVTVTYRDHDKQERTEDLYFHLGTYQLARLQVSSRQGWLEQIEKMQREEDSAGLMDEFEKIIRLSYGRRGADPKDFFREDEQGRPMADQFIGSLAFDKLFLMFLKDLEWTQKFFASLLPDDVNEELKLIDANLASGRRPKPQDHLQKAPRRTETVSDPMLVHTTGDDSNPAREALRAIYPDATDDALDRMIAIAHQK
jgi:hypothetical protein